MEFKHTKFDHTVNQSKDRDSVVFIKGVLGLTAVVVSLLVTLTVIVNLSARHLPNSVESFVWKNLQKIHIKESASTASAQSFPLVERIFRELPKPDIPTYLTLKVVVVKEKDPNAVSFPNGTIVVFEGLLNTLKSENALAFVLAHEVGHYAHRDHFKRIFGLVIYGLLNPLLGGAMTVPSTAVDAYFSQDTEAAADAYALNVLYKRYGHVGGATEFFTAIQQQDDNTIALFASHPLSKKRIETLRAIIKERGLPEKATVPLF